MMHGPINIRFLAKFTDIQRINKPCKSFHKSLHTSVLENKFDIIKENLPGQTSNFQQNFKVHKHSYLKISPLNPP